MHFILRWFVRLFGIFVFVRGSWMLWSLLRAYHLGLHRRVDGEVTYLGSSLHDTYYLVEHFSLSSAFLLALSGFLIVALALRH